MGALHFTLKVVGKNTQGKRFEGAIVYPPPGPPTLLEEYSVEVYVVMSVPHGMDSSQMLDVSMLLPAAVRHWSCDHDRVDGQSRHAGACMARAKILEGGKGGGFGPEWPTLHSVDRAAMCRKSTLCQIQRGAHASFLLISFSLFFPYSEELKRLWRSRRRKSGSVPAGAANFPAAVFLAGKCPNLGRDSISRCRKIGESFSSSVEICWKTFPTANFGQPQPSRVF